MPFQAVPFALGTAGVAAVGTGAWHVLTGNSCESWRTCAGSRKGHSLVPDRSGAEIATSLYHQTGPGHGNVHGVDNHTGPLPGARPPTLPRAPAAFPAVARCHGRGLSRMRQGAPLARDRCQRCTPT